MGKYGLSRLRADSSLPQQRIGHRRDVSVYQLGRASLNVCIASRAGDAGHFLYQRLPVWNDLSGLFRAATSLP